MSLFGILERRSSFANPDRWLLGLFGGQATDAGISVSEDSALTYTSVFACVNVISEAMGTLPLNLYKRGTSGGRELVTNLPIGRLLNTAPNDEMAAMSFKSTVMGWVLTWGNGYAEIERNRAGFPIALHPIAPNRVVPRRRTGDMRIEYQVTRTALSSPYSLEYPTVDALIDRDDMFHMAGLGFDGIMGYNPIRMAKQAVGLGLAAETYGSRFFGNSGVPSGTLESDKPIKDPEKLRKQWQNATGAGNQRGTAVLEDGVKFHSIGIPPEDSQFLETRKFQRSEIAGLYRVPPHMIGDLDRSTNNNIEHQGMDFVRYCLMGWLVRMEQEANRKLLTPDQLAAGYFYSFDADELLRGDRKSRYDAYAVARQWGWHSVDEIREKENMAALPDGQGQIYLVPSNMMNATQAASPPPAAASEPPAEKDAAVTTDSDEGDSTKRVDPAKLRASFRAMLLEAATKAVHKETMAIRRAAKKPDSFAATAADFYGSHGDHLRTVLIPVAACFSELYGKPFAEARDAVHRVADGIVQRSAAELKAPKVDVENLMQNWDAGRPMEIADTILKEIGV